MAEQLLTIRESSKRAHFGLTKMREVLALGVVPLIRFNQRVIRVREADLDSWIQAGCPLPKDCPAASVPERRTRPSRARRTNAGR